MEPVDAAYEIMVRLLPALESPGETESDARLRVIDRVFLEVLNWPHGEILTEDPSVAGFVDYNFTISGRSRLIVEAKRDGRSFELAGKVIKRGYKLNGPVFSSSHAREGIRQAIRYCGAKNAELACVTNGREWIIFRGNRLGDGRDTEQGLAFVFPTLEAVVEGFAFFYDLLSYEAVGKFDFRPHFQEAEGQPIRANLFRKALRVPGTARIQRLPSMVVDLDRVMTSFFDRIADSEDEDLLVECFVETSESDVADAKLVRASEELVSRIQSLDTGDPSALTTVIERVAETRNHEFVIIVGTKGSGKSTFITRFFRKVIKPELAKECVYIRVNIADNSGDPNTVATWLDQHLLERVERAIFGNDSPSFTELEGIFFDDYTRLRKGPWAELYTSDKTQFKINFGAWIEARREERPHEYIAGLVRHVVNVRKKLPIIIFDNADHFDVDFQERVYQYARSIYERELCLVIMPITDRTSWQLSRHGALQSFEHESLYLPTPAINKVLSKRVTYLHDKVMLQKERPDDRYFVRRGISLTVDDLSAFVRTLHEVFLESTEISQWIGRLANGDIRHSLKLTRILVTSGHMRLSDLVAAYLSGEAGVVNKGRAAMALIKGNYDIYPAGQNEFVQNLFTLVDAAETSPLLGLRILQCLNDVPQDDMGDAFISVDQVLQYFSGMGFDNRVMLIHLDELLRLGFVRDFDATILTANDAAQLELTSAGLQHLNWACWNYEYLSAMADVTPVRSQDVFDAIRNSVFYGGGGWREKTRLFIGYLHDEDAMYARPPEHKSYNGQRRMINSLEATQERLSGWIRKGDVEPASSDV